MPAAPARWRQLPQAPGDSRRPVLEESSGFPRRYPTSVTQNPGTIKHPGISKSQGRCPPLGAVTKRHGSLRWADLPARLRRGLLNTPLHSPRCQERCPHGNKARGQKALQLVLHPGSLEALRLDKLMDLLRELPFVRIATATRLGAAIRRAVHHSIHPAICIGSPQFMAF